MFDSTWWCVVIKWWWCEFTNKACPAFPHLPLLLNKPLNSWILVLPLKLVRSNKDRGTRKDTHKHTLTGTHAHTQAWGEVTESPGNVAEPAVSKGVEFYLSPQISFTKDSLSAVYLPSYNLSPPSSSFALLSLRWSHVRGRVEARSSNAFRGDWLWSLAPPRALPRRLAYWLLCVLLLPEIPVKLYYGSSIPLPAFGR